MYVHTSHLQSNSTNRSQARMLEDIDLSKLEVKGFSGAQLSPKYKPAQLVPSGTQKGTAGKFKGNCHCGQFKFSIKTPELKGIRTCNCSVCTKVGFPFCPRQFVPYQYFSQVGYMWLFP